MNRLRLRLGCIFLLAALPAPLPAQTLRVFAAASLQEAFQDIGRRFEALHRGVKVEFEFGGSPTLRAQIEQGAPADVFASADSRQMDFLSRGRKVESPRPFTHNRLVVVAPAGAVKVRNLGDLASPGLRLAFAGSEVPAGRYGDEMLAKADRSGRFGRGYTQRVHANVATRETNVRGVLAKVVLGEVDAGIVYATDVAHGRVRVIPVPKEFNVRATYPIAVVKAGRQLGLAREFVRFVLGREGKAALRRRGFAE